MNEHEKKEGQDMVPIIINKKERKTPPQTTGAALYLLGEIGAGYDLYSEVKGPGDDQLISNDGTPIQVKPGDHFYSAQNSLNPGAVR